MGDLEFAPKVPIAAHLAEFHVPKEIQEDIIKSGWNCALVWGSALKEEQLAKLFLRPGSTYGPASDGHEGGPQDSLATCVGPVLSTLSAPGRGLSILTPVGMLGLS